MQQPASMYDGQWTITLPAPSTTTTPVATDERGIFLGNGKLGIVTGVLDPSSQSTLMTVPLRYANGIYRANVMEPFQVDHVRFFDNDPNNTAVSTAVTTQALNMYAAIFTTSYTVTDASTGAVVDVQADLYAPQHLPFCIMQTLRITPRQDMAELDMYHELRAKDSLTGVSYNNNVIAAPDSGSGLYMLTGTATTRADAGTSIACTSGYLFENSCPGVDNLGFNVYRDDAGRCYNRFRLRNLTANTTARLHIISTLMSSYDFDAPLEEAKRIALSLCTTARMASPDPGAAAASRIRANHTAAWANLWNTDVTITPKVGITSAQDQELLALKRALRTALYNLYASTRTNVSLEVNPLNLSLLDLDGSALYSGDLWLVPVLIMLRPEAARTLLEHRHRLLATARQLAAGYGFKGAKFPYLTDTVGYKTSLYWDASGPMSVFNNALIAVNVWNYYRVTLDREWLSSKGYAILKDVADFFASKVDHDEDGTWHLRDVVGLDGSTTSSDQNTFTNNLVRLALRYAIEASYELQYNVSYAWLDIYYNLPVPTFAPDPDLYHVLTYDADQAANLATTYPLMEPLFTLLPYYSQLFFAPETGHTQQNALQANLDFYTARIDPAPAAQQHPFNLALKAVVSNVYAQYDPTYVAQFKAALDSFLATNTTGLWGHVGRSKSSDLTLCSVLLFTLLQGGMQLNVVGGVAETRFYYEELRLEAPPSANLPPTWKNIKASAVGRECNSTFITTNSLLYVS